MKAFNIVMSAVQGLLIGAYILFYNVQYYWSLKATIMNVVHLIAR